jgi:hypothetical protein
MAATVAEAWQQVQQKNLTATPTATTQPADQQHLKHRSGSKTANSIQSRC